MPSLFLIGQKRETRHPELYMVAEEGPHRFPIFAAGSTCQSPHKGTVHNKGKLLEIILWQSMGAFKWVCRQSLVFIAIKPVDYGQVILLSRD